MSQEKSSPQPAHTPGPWRYWPCRVDNTLTPPMYDYAQFANQAGERVFRAPLRYLREADARLIAAAPELLAEIERQYIELADIHNEWPGRNTAAGQQKLNRLLDLIVSATGRDRQEAQDDYGTRAARAHGAQA